MTRMPGTRVGRGGAGWGQMEIFWHVRRYEALFPELHELAHTPTKDRHAAPHWL